ncbi:MAG: uracil-DNA glycosylase, partial [Thermoproteus sp.]|nr:uracil-DNA glycosylase [Thermoproteus sp.]
ESPGAEHPLRHDQPGLHGLYLGSEVGETRRYFVVEGLSIFRRYAFDHVGYEGIDRGNDAFITNVVKCRPPENREPLDDEITACLPYLIAQIKAVKPGLIVALGMYSARTLLSLAGKRIDKLGDIRGRCYRAAVAGVETTICVTYHPAATLYNPRLRKTFEDDLAKFLGKGGGRDKGLLEYL